MDGGYRPPRDPELVTAALPAAGKALYIANCFEAKCKDGLRTANQIGCRSRGLQQTAQRRHWPS